MKERALLTRVEHNREITQETNRQFLFEYQRALLLALKEGGILNEVQFRYAEGNLKKRMKK